MTQQPICKLHSLTVEMSTRSVRSYGYPVAVARVMQFNAERPVYGEDLLKEEHTNVDFGMTLVRSKLAAICENVHFVIVRNE